MAGFFNKVIALLTLFYCLPFIIIIFIISFIVQGKPVFFSQIRISKNFIEFNFYKFRTMRNVSDGQLITVTGDNRVTRFGRILRKFKIDELPQLWNVVKREIEFVGPRAEVKEYVDAKNFSFLKNLKPGITDFSSVILRDEEAILNKIGGEDSYEKLLPLKLKLVDIYCANKNFFLDMEIIFLTILSIFFPIKAQTIILEKYINRYDNDLFLSLKSLLCQ